MNNIDGQKFQIKRFDKFETGPNTKYVIFLKDFYFKKKRKKKKGATSFQSERQINEPRLLPPRHKIRIPDIAREWKPLSQKYP